MTMMRSLSLPLVALLLLPSSCFSFVVTTPSKRSTSSSTRSSHILHLVPSQGKELEAFVNEHIEVLQDPTTTPHIEIKNDVKKQQQQHQHHHQEEANVATKTEAPPQNNNAIITPLTAARSFISRIFHQKDDEVLVYPIVGFRWVGNKVVPTTSAAACVLHRQRDENEELVGWFTAPPPPDDDDVDVDENWDKEGVSN